MKHTKYYPIFSDIEEEKKIWVKALHTLKESHTIDSIYTALFQDTQFLLNKINKDIHHTKYFNFICYINISWKRTIKNRSYNITS